MPSSLRGGNGKNDISTYIFLTEQSTWKDIVLKPKVSNLSPTLNIGLRFCLSDAEIVFKKNQQNRPVFEHIKTNP